MQKLPINKTDFPSIQKKGYAYVDKTARYVELIEQGDAYFLSRPKGYGKSLMLSTMAAMFRGDTESFAGLTAETWVTEQKKHPKQVLLLDMSLLDTDSALSFEHSLLEKLLAFGKKLAVHIPVTTLKNTIVQLFEEIAQRFDSFVLLIDNFDIVPKKASEIAATYTVLRSFYEIVENSDAYLHFLLVTGEEKFTKYGVFSTIPTLLDISAADAYHDLLGFTQEEIRDSFSDHIALLAEKSHVNPKNILNSLAQTGCSLFHPASLFECLSLATLDAYSEIVREKTLNKIQFYSCIEQSDTDFLEVRKYKIYVDKTNLLIHTNNRIETEHKYICISRPRRFGKTISANMVAGYYDVAGNAKESFSSMNICQHPTFALYANKYIVIKITIQDYLSKTHDIDKLLYALQKDILRDLFLRYGSEENCSDINRAMQFVAALTGRKFVIVLDEWDCILREYKDKLDWQKKYLDFLRYWFKDKSYIALVYMTGILPIKKYGTHSALNIFDEYSMLRADPFTEFIGFTESEVQELCKKYSRNFLDCKAWYDGYQVDNYTSIYNPRSVNQYISTGILETYWNTTETYEALRCHISLKNFGLHEVITKLLSNAEVPVCTSTFANDMSTFRSKDDVLTLLVHLGYLSYAAQDGTVRIPNKEITEEFVTAIRAGGWPIVVAAIDASANLLAAALRGDAAYVAKGVQAAHMETSHLQYNDENALAYTISLAFFAARENYTIVREFPTGKGFADLVFLPRPTCTGPALLVELKWNVSVTTALSQIRERQYPDSLRDHFGSILLVGITYDRKTKQHTCIIEHFDAKPR